jgi:transketolase
MNGIVRDTGKTYGETLVRLAEKNPAIVVLEADLAKASGSGPFKEKYPNRYYDVGIAEQNLFSFSAGLAAMGKIPFASTFACFASQRGCDQIMNSVAYNMFNVKIIGTYAGLTSEKNGGTHISVADLAIFRSMPGMIVIDPGDALEFSHAIEEAANHTGPVYIRSNKGAFPVFHTGMFRFTIGKAQVLREGSGVSLIATGIVTQEAIRACEKAEKAGIHVRLVHMPTIKPIDAEEIITCAEKTGTIISAENHSIMGGLGSAITEVVCARKPCPVIRLGLRDCFGETATLDYLLHKHGIDAETIFETICSAAKGIP